jgi:hypothetical protein
LAIWGAAEARRGVVADQYAAKPVPFDLSHMLYQSLEGQRRRGTDAVRNCSSVSPAHLAAKVARQKSSQLSSVVRSSASNGGIGRSVGVMIGTTRARPDNHAAARGIIDQGTTPLLPGRVVVGVEYALIWAVFHDRRQVVEFLLTKDPDLRGTERCFHATDLGAGGLSEATRGSPARTAHTTGLNKARFGQQIDGLATGPR